MTPAVFGAEGHEEDADASTDREVAPDVKLLQISAPISQGSSHFAAGGETLRGVLLESAVDDETDARRQVGSNGAQRGVGGVGDLVHAVHEEVQGELSLVAGEGPRGGRRALATLRRRHRRLGL